MEEKELNERLDKIKKLYLGGDLDGSIDELWSLHNLMVDDLGIDDESWH